MVRMRLRPFESFVRFRKVVMGGFHRLFGISAESIYPTHTHLPDRTACNNDCNCSLFFASFSLGRAWTKEYQHYLITSVPLLLHTSFIVANKRLYKRLCPSVRPSVCPSICPSVRPSGISEFKPKSDLTSINAPAQRSRLIWSCIRLCFTSTNQSWDWSEVVPWN